MYRQASCLQLLQHDGGRPAGAELHQCRGGRRSGAISRNYSRQLIMRLARQVLDRINGVAYVCLSERADAGLAQAWADQLGYQVSPGAS